MAGEIIQWPVQGDVLGLGLHYRLESLVAIFRAIHAGELLAALPSCEQAQEQHRTATQLLSIVERELLAIVEELERRPEISR